MKGTDRLLRWTIIIATAVITISISYYFLWFLPKKEKAEQERYRQARVDACLKDLEETNSPIAQRLTQGLVGATSEPESKLMRDGLQGFLSIQDEQRTACKNLK